MRCFLNRFLAGTCVFVFALFAIGSANAQEFNGFYVGGNAGVVSGRVSPLTVPVFSPTGYFASTSTPAIAKASDGQHFDPDRLTAGGEFKVAKHWSVKGEYLRLGFGDQTVSQNLTTSTPPAAFPTNNFNHSVDASLNVVRGGVNFRF